MSIVTRGWGCECVVTRGWGCPPEEFVQITDIVCDLASKIDPRVLLLSPTALNTMVMSFVSQTEAVNSMVTLECNINSLVSQMIDLVSVMDPPAEVELVSTVTLIIDISSEVCCC